MNHILRRVTGSAVERLRTRLRTPTTRPSTTAAIAATPPPTRDADDDPLSTVELTVNGHSVSVPQGMTILEAARSCGVLIPTLCAHPRLSTETFTAATATAKAHGAGDGGKQGSTGNRGAGVHGGLCRVCLVDVGGERLSPACATPVSPGMRVQTDTPEVDRCVRGVLSMLRSSGDHGDCATCEASGECELQTLLARYHVVEGVPVPRDAASHEWDGSTSDGEEGEEPRPRGRRPPTKKHDQDSWRHSGVDSTNAAISIDLSKCIECGRCVSACGVLQGIGAIGFAGRGGARHVAAFGDAKLGDDGSPCIGCGQCSLACPTGAIEAVSHWRRVRSELEAKRKKMVVQVAPAVRVAIGEEMGLGPGTVSTGQLVAALRLLGFDYVFDTNFAADVTVMEESAELLRRLRGEGTSVEGDEERSRGGDVSGSGSGSGSRSGSRSGSGSGSGSSRRPRFPMFTSCCPAWVTMVERTYPHLAGSLSTTKSPHIILGTIAKKIWAPSVGIGGGSEGLFVTSVMPCTAKKSEAAREDLMIEVPSSSSSSPPSTVVVPAVDAVITTRELGRMLRDASIPLGSLDPDSRFDSPLGSSSGAAALFGTTGGVAEAALRSAFKELVGSELGAGGGGAGRGKEGAADEGDANPLTPIRGLAGIRELVLPLPEHARKLAGGRRELRVAVASGAGAARALVERITREATEEDDEPSPPEESRRTPRLPRFDFVEVMACPGGCVGGGGQPRVRFSPGKGFGPAEALAARARAIYSIDEGSRERRSHENEAVRELYESHLGGSPGSDVAEALLHRTYGKG